jgi:hypothetical protein
MDPNTGETATQVTQAPSVMSSIGSRQPTFTGDVEANNSKKRKQKFFNPLGSYNPPSTTLGYELPKAVSSIRDGWQWTCQSGAVVSGLLAAVAAQLLALFKTLPSPNPSCPPNTSCPPNIHIPGGAQGFLLAACYAALFLNISATISSFILIDNLGEIEFRASCKGEAFHENVKRAKTMTRTQDRLLVEFGATGEWKWMLFHWLATFYSGILALIIAILTYVSMQEALATKIVMGVIVFFTLVPVSYFIFIRPCYRN